MKKLFNNILLVFSLSLLLVSCEDNEMMLQPNDFSDVSFINSQLIDQWSDNIIEVGSPISFMDLSQNAVTHTWTIEESCSFLYGKYTENDTVYDSFIIPNAGTVTTDITAYVLFNEPGNEIGVKINNSFRDEVTYTAFPDDLSYSLSYTFEYSIGSEYNSSTGLWDFEAEYIFKVLDKVDATVSFFIGDELIAEVDKGIFGDESEMDSWATIEISTDDIITIQADVYGEPETMKSYFSSNLNSVDTIESTSETVSTNPKITRLTEYYFPSALGNFDVGYMKLVRSSGTSDVTVPASSVTKTLPLKFNVTMGTGDLEAAATVTDFDEITFSLSALASTLPSAVKNDFSVTINNPDKSITNESITISSVSLNSAKSAFVVRLASEIYVDDEITIKYTPASSAIEDIYGRELAAFEITDPTFFDPVITDSEMRGFEGEQSSDKSIYGWFLQDYPYWAISDEQVYSGNASLKYYNDGLDDSDSTWTCQSNATYSELSGSAGRYLLEAWVWVDAYATITSDITFAFESPTATLTSTTTPISDVTRGKWCKIEREYTFSADLVEATTKMNIKMSNENVGTMYIDDISLSRVQTRP